MGYMLILGFKKKNSSKIKFISQCSISPTSRHCNYEATVSEILKLFDIVNVVKF